MITCSNCSTSNPDSTQTCISCGALLVEANELPAVEDMPQAENEIPDPSAYVEPEQPLAAPASDSTAPVPGSEPVQPPTIEFPSPKKDRNQAIILEVVPGVFGFLGIGWIYSGYTTAGIAWLVGFLIWNMIALTICFFTFGLGCFCTLPINLIVLIASVVALNSQIQNHTEQFIP
jgi:hypothetical protein